MNVLKVGLCFLDHENKPIVIKPLESNWSVELNHDIRITERSYRDKIRDEITVILTEQVKSEITDDIIRDMLEEIGEVKKYKDPGFDPELFEQSILDHMGEF